MEFMDQYQMRMASRLMNFKILDNGTDLAEIAILTKFVLNYPSYREWYDELVLPFLKQRRTFVKEQPKDRIRLYRYLLNSNLDYLVPKPVATHILQCKLKDIPALPYSGVLV